MASRGENACNASRRTAPPLSNNLVKDEGGAIMLMGLAMILGLIAFLWYLLGIGATLAFRDRMQDAADSSAFSQVAVEAAGMNLIVFLNMLIMLLVIVYLLASIVLTVYWGVMVVEVATCPEGLLVCAEGLEMLYEYAFGSLYDDRGDLGSLLSKLDMGISILESGVAIAAPWAGTAASIDASTSYKLNSMTSAPFGAALGPNNMPDLEAVTSLGRKTGVSYGLPVTHEHLGNDCGHLIDMIGGSIAGLFGGKGGGKISSMLNGGAGAAGSIFQWYYCDSDNTPPFPMPSLAKKVMKVLKGLPVREIIGGGDAGSYWTADGYGPMENFKHVEVDTTNMMDGMKPTKKRHDKEFKNGADNNQSYSVVIAPSSFNDHNATHNIKLMQLNKPGWYTGAKDKPLVLFYFAQAELFFDCNKGWRSPRCDDLTDNMDHIDMTMYRFEWRARLVKFHAPEGSGLASVLSVINKGLGMITDVKGWVNGNASNPFIKALQFLDQLTGTNFLAMIAGIADIPPTQIFH